LYHMGIGHNVISVLVNCILAGIRTVKKSSSDLALGGQRDRI